MSSNTTWSDKVKSSNENNVIKPKVANESNVQKNNDQHGQQGQQRDQRPSSVSNSCVFCDILRDPKHPRIIKRGPHVTAIHKDYPSKTVNFLLVSNSHIKNAKELNTNKLENAKIWCEFLSAAKSLSNGRDFGIKMPCGENAGQNELHMHMHIYSYDEPWFRNTYLDTLDVVPQDYTSKPHPHFKHHVSKKFKSNRVSQCSQYSDCQQSPQQSPQQSHQNEDNDC